LSGKVEITITAFPPAKRNMNINARHQKLFSEAKNRIKNGVRRLKKSKFFSVRLARKFHKGCRNAFS